MINEEQVTMATWGRTEERVGVNSYTSTVTANISQVELT